MTKSVLQTSENMDISLNHSLNFTQQNVTLPEVTFITENHALIINSMLMTLSFIGNTYIIFFICKQKRARNAHNIALVSVAVADILICVVVIPFYLTVNRYTVISPNSAEPSSNPYFCKIYSYLFSWCKTVKIYSALAMVVDRYYRITMPTQNANLSGRCIFFLTLVWFFGSAFNVWQLILTVSGVTTWTEYNMSVRCCLPASEFNSLQTAYQWSTLLITYALPLLAFIWCYIVIFLKYFTQSDYLFPRKSRRRLGMTILSGFVFYMCQFPAELSHYWMDTQREITLPLFCLNSILQSLAFSQGLLNVVCYFCCGADVSSEPPTLSFCHLPNRQGPHPPASQSGRGIQILVTSGSMERLNRH